MAAAAIRELVRIAWADVGADQRRPYAPSTVTDHCYPEAMSAIMENGLAVIVTDYHGLIRPGRNRQMKQRAPAFDAIYFVAAAHAVEHRGSAWAAVGHVQGGLAVWTVAELQVEFNGPD